MSENFSPASPVTVLSPNGESIEVALEEFRAPNIPVITYFPEGIMAIAVGTQNPSSSADADAADTTGSSETAAQPLPPRQNLPADAADPTGLPDPWVPTELELWETTEREATVGNTYYEVPLEPLEPGSSILVESNEALELLAALSDHRLNPHRSVIFFANDLYPGGNIYLSFPEQAITLAELEQMHYGPGFSLAEEDIVLAEYTHPDQLKYPWAKKLIVSQSDTSRFRRADYFGEISDHVFLATVHVSDELIDIEIAWERFQPIVDIILSNIRSYPE